MIGKVIMVQGTATHVGKVKEVNSSNLSAAIEIGVYFLETGGFKPYRACIQGKDMLFCCRI